MIDLCNRTPIKGVIDLQVVTIKYDLEILLLL